MADADIEKTVDKALSKPTTKPDKKDVTTNESDVTGRDSVSSTSGTDSGEASGSTVDDTVVDETVVEDEPEIDETAPVLAIVPGDVAESSDDIHPTGNKPDAVQFPVTGPRLPGIYLDDVEKYQDEVKSSVMEGRAPDDSLNPFTGEGKDVTSDHSPAGQAAKSDHSNVNAH